MECSTAEELDWADILFKLVWLECFFADFDFLAVVTVAVQVGALEPESCEWEDERLKTLAVSD